MGLIFLFRKLMFTQVLLGIVTFCMAEGNPGMLLVAGALGALSWYVVEGPTGKPLPQWVIIIGAMAAVAVLLGDLYRNQGNVILAMGHFTMWLQVLLLYAKKTNRDYGMIMVLSLMQMIGASVITSTFLFALLLVGYCGLALVTLLLFQLKWTSDFVTEANQAASPRPTKSIRPKAVVGKGHRWHFRFLTTCIGLVCGFIAILVFMAMPRTGESKFNSELTNPLAGTQAGFSDQIQLGGDPINSAGRAPVLNMAVWSLGKKVSDTNRSFLLRGSALDRYDERSHIWSRTSGNNPDQTFDLPRHGLWLARLPEKTPLLQADISLRIKTDNVLFTLQPIAFLRSQNLPRVKFNAIDQGLATLLDSQDDKSEPAIYSVFSPTTPPDGMFDTYLGRMGNTGKPLLTLKDNKYTINFPASYAAGWRNNPKGIRQWATSVLAPAGLTRDFENAYTPHDRRIAQTLADYMQSNFRYTLEAQKLPRNVDPIDNFLLARKQGHCELFAAGLAAACRSLGMRARVISGYMASDYNRVGGYYMVRQSDAHAWTEVFCGPEGWVAFDSTPPADVAEEHMVARGKLGILSEFFEHIEFAWISKVVSYDSTKRNQILATAMSSVRNITTKENSWVTSTIKWLKGLPEKWKFDRLTYTIAGVIIFFVIIAIISLVHRTIVRSRRLTALQLNRLPRKERKKLVNRLRFYLQMLDILDRHGYVRPTWQSPFSFAQELADANPMRFDPVIALTELFYEIRFGHRELDPERQGRIQAHLKQLEHALIRPKN